jgi:hypothetical protein
VTLVCTLPCFVDLESAHALLALVGCGAVDFEKLASKPAAFMADDIIAGFQLGFDVVGSAVAHASTIAGSPNGNDGVMKFTVVRSKFVSSPSHRDSTRLSESLNRRSSPPSPLYPTRNSTTNILNPTPLGDSERSSRETTCKNWILNAAEIEQSGTQRKVSGDD